MSEYTPTTDDVREDFAFPWSVDQIGDRSARVAAFDRWLASVKAEAWDERDRATATYDGPDGGHEYDCMGWEDCYCGHYPNPYREDPK